MISYKHFKPLLSSRFLPSFVLFLALSLFTGVLQAQLIPWPAMKAKDVSGDVDFIFPNEKKPKDQLPILFLAKPGLLMGVGTERLFMTAALSDKITHVLFTDRTSGITLFNQINIMLLSLKPDREFYLSLRLAKNFEVWEKALTELNPESSARELLGSREVYNWWKVNVVYNPNFKFFHGTASSEEYLKYISRMGFEPYKDANYLFDDVLFARLYKLAAENKMQAVNVNLEKESFKEVIMRLKGTGLRLAIADISNAWASTYMQQTGTEKFIQLVDKIADNGSILLTTRPIAREWEFGWRYQGFDFKYIRSYKDKTYTSFYSDNLSRGRLQLTDSAIFNDSVARVKMCVDGLGALVSN